MRIRLTYGFAREIGGRGGNVAFVIIIWAVWRFGEIRSGCLLVRVSILRDVYVQMYSVFEMIVNDLDIFNCCVLRVNVIFLSLFNYQNNPHYYKKLLSKEKF